jgi:hypothetical protein
MYKRPTTKQLVIQRVIVLSVMFVSICVIVVATMLSILGYRLDGLNGRLEQGALVQFESVPSGARVSIDGDYFNTTPTKRSVLGGERVFKMERDGYVPWTKSVPVEAGTLLWLDYVRLIPETLQRTVVSEYETVSGVEASADLQAIAIKADPAEPSFELVDIRAREVASTTLAIPATLYSESSDTSIERTFTLDQWDPDGRYILVQHDYEDTREWLVVDTQDVSRSVNVTRLLGIDFSDLEFAGTSGNTLFGLSSGVIRELDLAAATLSRALVTNVLSFSVYDSNILSYTGTDPDDRTVSVAGVYRDGDREPVIVYRSSSENARLFIDTSRYFNDRYIAVGDKSTVTVYKGDYPTNEAAVEELERIETFLTPGAMTSLSFSPSGNHLVAQSGLEFIGYEVEYDRVHESSVLTEDSSVRTLQWLDGALLSSVQDGILTLREFDGANRNSIMPAVSGFDVTLSQNGRYIYAITQTDDTFRLERVTLILE